MHEYSIVQALLDQCEEHAAKHNAQKVTKIVAKIGVLSGVEKNLLHTAFDTFREGTVCSEAEFVINMQPVVIRCPECGHDSTIDDAIYMCGICGNSENLSVVDGEDMYLMSLEIE